MTKVDSRTPNDPINFQYSARDRLVQVKKGLPGSEEILGQFDYNHEGNRIRHRHSDRGDVDYYYDDGAVIEERNAADDSLLAYYQYADRLIALAQPTGTQYYHHDALGSTIGLTDAAGADKKSYHLDPWGNIRWETGSSDNRHIFTGKEHDKNTGLVYFGARYYDPEIGRFLTQDTYLGESNTPPSLHRYLYVYSNPMVYIDPTGHAGYKTIIKKLDEVEEERRAEYDLQARSIERAYQRALADPDCGFLCLLAIRSYMGLTDLEYAAKSVGQEMLASPIEAMDYAADAIIDVAGIGSQETQEAAAERLRPAREAIVRTLEEVSEKGFEQAAVEKAGEVSAATGEFAKKVFIEGEGEARRQFYKMAIGAVVLTSGVSSTKRAVDTVNKAKNISKIPLKNNITIESARVKKVRPVAPRKTSIREKFAEQTGSVPGKPRGKPRVTRKKVAPAIRAKTKPRGRQDTVHTGNKAYDNALNSARKNTGDLGANTQKMYDPETGTLIGERSADGRRGWRIDKDHVNWWDWSKGKKGTGGRYGHESFPMKQSGPHSKHPGYTEWE